MRSHSHFFHLHASDRIKRSRGRSAVAAAAYRSGEALRDSRNATTWDFTRREGVLTTLLLRAKEGEGREAFWNRAEAHCKRGDAVVVREVEAALPDCVPEVEAIELAKRFGNELADHYGVAVDMAVHRSGERNIHVHYLLTSFQVSQFGEFARKQELLDPLQCKAKGLQTAVEVLRPRWSQLSNELLARYDLEPIDHRSYKDRGIDREPTIHRGTRSEDVLDTVEISRGVSKRLAKSRAQEVGEEIVHAMGVVVGQIIDGLALIWKVGWVRSKQVSEVRLDLRENARIARVVNFALSKETATVFKFEIDRSSKVKSVKLETVISKNGKETMMGDEYIKAVESNALNREIEY